MLGAPGLITYPSAPLPGIITFPGGVPSSAWTPGNLPGILPSLSIALQRSSGLLWQDASKTVPAVAHNDPVRVAVCPWTGVDCTAPSDAARPLLRTDGTYWGLYHGGSTKLNTPLVAPVSGTQGSHGFAINIPATANSRLYCWRNGANSNSILWDVVSDGTNLFGRCRNDAGASLPSSVFAANGAGNHTGVMNWDGANCYLRWDSAAASSFAFSGTTTTTGGTTSGDALNFANFSGMTYTIYEYITTSGFLSAANTTLLEAYLTARRPA